uniref:Dinitrogenase iron-molybdenum cofactor biosynthesis domain-containing protein n=1 Tax=Gracilinema caldarium TaxID=215591 RepID=A0A7C3EC97_9SPIR
MHVAVKVIHAVLRHQLDVVFTPRIGEIAFHMLKDHFVDIYRAEEGTTVRQVIESFMKKESEPIAHPHPAEESEIGRQRVTS